MSHEILVNATPHEVRIALLENHLLREIYIERLHQQSLVGNIYQGRVMRVLPGMQAAFVDIGLERSGFLHLSGISREATADDDVRKYVRQGQDILVQVSKDALGSKGVRLTTHFMFPGRYLVFTPGVFQIVVSQKITDPLECARLQAMLVPNLVGGYIFRTAAEGVNQAEIAADQDFFATVWAGIQSRRLQALVGDIIYEEIPGVLRMLRDSVRHDVTKICVDHQATAEKMRQFAGQYMPHWVDCIEFYDSVRPIFDKYAVEDTLQKALYRKVYLKSGGYLVFDQTEAMTTIDVNTGSFLGHTSLAETTYQINVEAAEIIAQQVRLRNLGGIIIIDFIDMQIPQHQAQLLQVLRDFLAKDSVKVQMSLLSSLGLVQMTRKRTRESLAHILCESCKLCHGRGFLKSIRTIAVDIMNDIKHTAYYFSWPGFLVIAAQDVVNCLLTEGFVQLTALEATLGKQIQIRIESSYLREQYDVLPLAEKE